LTSPSHASGADLTTLAAEVASTPGATVLDLGCGAGHVSFAVAPHARAVTAYDLSPEMLSIVADAARERGLGNIATQQGAVEALPFGDAAFDWVVSRFSAHHWHDLPRALVEVRRVLKPGGRVIFVDVSGPDHPLLDTHLQAVEVLRDGSHVRNYRADEWISLFAGAGFTAQIRERWRLPMKFDPWIARMRTPEVRASAIRSLWRSAPDEVRAYFAVEPDGSFMLDVLMVDAR
jgi:SAM-dependent methyltransferase